MNLKNVPLTENRKPQTERKDRTPNTKKINRTAKTEKKNLTLEKMMYIIKHKGRKNDY
jgi:hypothetical protein